jgi:hypothetical protein
MESRDRRKFEMGQGVSGFMHTRTDLGPAFTTAIGQLDDRIGKSEGIAARQLEGVRIVRAASQRKTELRRALTGTHLSHLVHVGKVASKDVPELAQKFVFRPGSRSNLGFRTAARGMVAEAETHRDVLLKYGLGEDVLADLAAGLDQFDAALEQGQAGRQAHVGASAELHALADEIVQIVNVMDGLVRHRFRNDAETLAAWESASNVPGPFRSAKPETPESTPAPGGDGARAA